MAGEIVKTEGVCLGIRPWSRTSHVVTWLTPAGRVVTVVKGAVRPKSAFLGQYDLNYTCEVLYYARAKGEVHALRECAPLVRRDALRGDYRALVLAEYFRLLAARCVPTGPDAAAWLVALEDALDRLTGDADTASPAPGRGAFGAADPLVELLRFELKVLDLTGLRPAVGAENGALALRGERAIAVSPQTAACLADPTRPCERQFLLDAARVIGVYYAFHLDCAPDTRRTVLGLVSERKKEGK